MKMTVHHDGPGRRLAPLAVLGLLAIVLAGSACTPRDAVVSDRAESAGSAEAPPETLCDPSTHFAPMRAEAQSSDDRPSVEAMPDPFGALDRDALKARRVWEERFPRLFQALSSDASGPGCVSSEHYDQSGFQTHELPDGSLLGAFLCMTGAYNTGYAYFHIVETDSGHHWSRVSFPACSTATRPRRRDVVFNPGYDENTGNLTTFIKGRGLADCGTSSDFYWQTASNEFCMRRCSDKPSCDGRMDNWPETVDDADCVQDPAFSPVAGDEGGDTADTGEHGAATDEHGHGHDHRFQDADALAERWNAEERMEWQKPDALIEAMAIEPGMRVADLGVGTGFFLPYLAEAVGAHGRIAGVDIEPTLLDYVDEHVVDDLVPDVELCLADTARPPFLGNSLDRVVAINVWHHIGDRDGYARAMLHAFRDGGAFYIVEYTMEPDEGPPRSMRLAPAELVAELEDAGYDATIVPVELPRQYVVCAVPRVNGDQADPTP